MDPVVLKKGLQLLQRHLKGAMTALDELIQLVDKQIEGQKP